ncbi:MAG: 4-hydroxy-tetrahydrodipicolinate synthase [Gemmatimonadota bacterium]|nr:4-hydroxy-tetrahydrodipicolinate synthase [Gemmatimonadota bacterium]
MKTLRGCGTAIVTPFQDDGGLDIPALRSLVEWQIEEGIDSLVACGSTGEAQTLSPDERETVVATVVEVAAGRVPIMAGATDNDTSRAADETRRMCALGVDFILSAGPYYNKPTQEGLFRHFSAVADAATVPVCLYNVPGRSAVNILPETVLRLAAHANICGIKEASGSVEQAMHIIQGRPDDFWVLSGEDALAVALIVVGADGLVSVASNEVPALMQWMVGSALDGNFGESTHLLYRLLPLLEANFVETNPAPVKAALAAMGRIHNVLRLPLVAMTEARLPALLDALRRAGVELPNR